MKRRKKKQKSQKTKEIFIAIKHCFSQRRMLE